MLLHVFQLRFFAHQPSVGLDIALFTAMLYFTGGTTNPTQGLASSGLGVWSGSTNLQIKFDLAAVAKLSARQRMLEL